MATKIFRNKFNAFNMSSMKNMQVEAEIYSRKRVLYNQLRAERLHFVRCEIGRRVIYSWGM